ncbi:MAG: hypothetical protein DIU56_005745 [Pseudomonadota bacterium]|nr:MAG: hypothetical protein DIU56_06275 [Pseudomonadota bacterium]
MSYLYELAARIETSTLGVAIAESHFAYPAIEGVHLIGLAISVGLIFLIDLRLMGLLLTRLPLEDVVRQLRRWVLGGFAATFVSGLLLFWSSAARMLESPAFAFKMLFILLAGLNALWFELVIARRHAPPALKVGLPFAFRCAGFASLTLWTLTLVCGRLIPYIPQWPGFGTSP